MQKEKLHLLIQDTLTYLKADLKTEKKTFFPLKESTFAFFQPYLQQNLLSKKQPLPPKPRLPLAPLASQTAPKANFPSPQKAALLRKMITPSQHQPAQNPKEKKDFREPEKPSCNLTLSFQHFKDLMQLVNPRTKVLEETLDDTRAKEIASSWKLKSKVGKITLLIFGENPKELFFLKELAKALHLLFQPTKIINVANLEKENKWDDYLSQPYLKLLLITDVNLWKLKNLVQHYHENPTTNETFLKEVPVILLPQISLYFKEPLMKKNLYETLKKKIKAISFL